MIILITGASHTGKTLLAQRLLEQYHFPYLSLDHLKMGLIRSGSTLLTPLRSDEALTEYLWPIAREMIKTVLENRQNLIVEGCYIPFSWAKDFSAEYRQDMRCYCLVLSERYIRAHFADIVRFAHVIESRISDKCSLEQVLADNAHYHAQAQAHGIPCIVIDETYEIDLDALYLEHSH